MEDIGDAPCWAHLLTNTDSEKNTQHPPTVGFGLRRLSCGTVVALPRKTMRHITAGEAGISYSATHTTS